MLTKHGLEFAVNIIKSHFGDHAAKVCKCLLQKGPLTFQALVHSTELRRDQLKKCLLVLIQHNCVQAFTLETEENDDQQKILIQYTAIFDNIHHRSRFSKFMQIVAEQLDCQCEELLNGLLQHGRLTLESLIARALYQKKGCDPGAQVAHRANFTRLVNARFVERCPSGQSVVESIPENAKRRRAKFAGAPPTTEERAIAAAAPSDSERFSVVEADSDIDARTSQHISSHKAGEKRRYEALNTDNDSMAAIFEKEVLWRANFEELIRRLRHKACVANVRLKLDVKTGTVLEAILEATSTSEEKVKEEKSVPLSMDAILQAVRGRPEGLEMTLEHVRAAINQLGYIPSMTGMEGLYSIDLKKIINDAQSDQVESLVLNKYGTVACKIFRLLKRETHMLETNKISDAILVDKKEASATLFRLWKDNFLDMERLTASLPKQQSFFLWKVKNDSLWAHVLDSLYHAALNISQRLVYELEQEQELTQINPALMTEALEKRYIRLRQVKLILESSLLKLDDDIMLFHDF